MAKLATMPPLVIPQAALVPFGVTWTANGGNLSRTPPQSSGELGKVFDTAVGDALAAMLGGIPVVTPNANLLNPSLPDCVEVGPVRVIGGVRPQNFDVGYRPDGIRFAFDSKTLNDANSVGKNWQNMVNDLAMEATTVHSRAEAIALVIWSPSDGTVLADVPAQASPLHFENFSIQVETAYVSRYKGLPPHAA